MGGISKLLNKLFILSVVIIPSTGHNSQAKQCSKMCALFFSSFMCTPQPKLYKSVIEDVINEVRELFLDEGVDEQVLLELKTVASYRTVLSS